MFILMTSGPVTYLGNNAAEQVFIAGCLVFNIVVSGTFQGSLTKAYTATIYYPDINTLEDLDESGLYIYTSSPGMMDLFGSGSDDEVINALGRKLCLTEKRKSIKLVAKNRNIASVERYDDAKLLETVTMYGQVHVIPECPRDYHISYIVRVGWPMLPDFDKMIQDILKLDLHFCGLIVLYTKLLFLSG
ncbi:uncharacterized protein LOC113384978 [Ctenocephalides felis]|uniref:uncharacterized protein LOC113384978 n=1 Tax=Ctenocephalides felis TaxID=7515 RepID=UPI000E6E3D92|nr:uncharacterized protein LOC113384978 [Ctenocephalides felis]